MADRSGIDAAPLFMCSRVSIRISIEKGNSPVALLKFSDQVVNLRPDFTDIVYLGREN